MQFLDSMQFAKSSLAELVKTMNEDDFVETKKLFNIADKSDHPATVHHAHPEWEVQDPSNGSDPTECEWCRINQEEEKRQQAFQKGVFCYDYLDSLEKFDETSLPDADGFFNRLTDTEITWQEERHARRVWKLQGCATLRDYHDFYLKCDTVILADFFEKFRRQCMESYGLDAAHYFSTPGLALDSALKVSGVSLELLDNAPMYALG